jgi:hypothetical protein
MTAVVIVQPQTGSGDVTYTHTQAIASPTWAIQHNLGKRPSVSIQDTAGSQVVGSVEYIDENNLVVTFSAPFSGRADLN